MLSTIIGVWTILVNKTSKDPCPHGIAILVGGGSANTNNKNNKMFY